MAILKPSLDIDHLQLLMTTLPILTEDPMAMQVVMCSLFCPCLSLRHSCVQVCPENDHSKGHRK